MMLGEDQIDAIIAAGVDQMRPDGLRVLVLIPDHTRTMPLPLFFRLLARHLQPRVRQLDFMVALGTHPPLSAESLLRLVGLTAAEKAARHAEIGLLNHVWNDPTSLTTLGILSAAEIAELSSGMLRMEVPVRLNRRVLDYDQLLVCGPVFPHEVVGFSGGNKYFFPGIAGADIIDFTHWLGALITSYSIIGTPDTPVRRVIDRAAALIPRERFGLCSVIAPHSSAVDGVHRGPGVEGVFFGTPESAWRSAAALSAQTHVRYVERPFRRVLSVLPEMYDEIWVGAKGMYKMEPVIADGGEVILYAPHLREFSVAHGTHIREIGYHVRDYFVQQWDQFKHIPWGVLAHSTHLRGIGTYDKVTGQESPRIQVSLATGIPEAVCRAVGLGYRDPASIDPVRWQAEAAPDTLVVPRAGEFLYRLSEPAG